MMAYQRARERERKIFAACARVWVLQYGRLVARNFKVFEIFVRRE